MQPVADMKRVRTKRKGKRRGCCDCLRQLDSVKRCIVLNLSTVTKQSENRLIGRKRETRRPSPWTQQAAVMQVWVLDLPCYNTTPCIDDKDANRSSHSLYKYIFLCDFNAIDGTWMKREMHTAKDATSDSVRFQRSYLPDITLRMWQTPLLWLSRLWCSLIFCRHTSTHKWDSLIKSCDALHNYSKYFTDSSSFKVILEVQQLVVNNTVYELS